MVQNITSYVNMTRYLIGDWIWVEMQKLL